MREYRRALTGEAHVQLRFDPKNGGRNWLSEVRTFTQEVTVITQAQICDVTAPDRVPACTDVELCAPDFDEVHYAWSGHGLSRRQGKHITDGTASRCVTVPGLSPGHYEYTLQLTNGDAVEACTWYVTVVDSTANCFVNGPADVFAHEAFEPCGPAGDHTYLGHGNGIPRAPRAAV